MKLHRNFNCLDPKDPEDSLHIVKSSSRQKYIMISNVISCSLTGQVKMPNLGEVYQFFRYLRFLKSHSNHICGNFNTVFQN